MKLRSRLVSGERYGAVWPSADLAEQRRMMGTVLNTITVLPGRRGARVTFDRFDIQLRDCEAELQQAQW